MDGTEAVSAHRGMPRRETFFARPVVSTPVRGNLPISCGPLQAAARALVQHFCLASTGVATRILMSITYAITRIMDADCYSPVNTAGDREDRSG